MRNAVVFSLLLILPASTWGQGETKWSWKFKEGETIFIEKVETVKQTIEQIGKPINQEMETTSVYSLRITKVESERTTGVLKIESIRIKGALADADAVNKKLSSLSQVSLPVVLGSDGKIQKIEGFGEAIKKSAASPGDQAYFKSVLNEENLKYSLAETFGFLPDHAVKPGDTWTREFKIPIGPYGQLRGEYGYLFKGKEKDEQVIPFTLKAGYDLPANSDLGSGIKVIQSEFKVNLPDTPDGLVGSLWFNSEKGRLVRAEYSLSIRGTVTLEKEGKSISLNMELKPTFKTRILDQNPIK